MILYGDEMNENFSIDDIIRQAEKIKQETEYHLKMAEKSLDEKAKNTIEEVTVEPEKVINDVSRNITENAGNDDDTKKYNVQSSDDDGDMKIVSDNKNNAGKTKVIGTIKSAAERTKRIILPKDSDDDSDMKIASDLSSGADIFEEDEPVKPVAISSNSRVDKKSDLQEIPTIMAVDQLDRVSFYDAEFKEETGVQMKFEGFDDEIENVDSIDENLAEQQLEERRREKVGKFRLFGPDETDKELGDKAFAKEEYVSTQEKDVIINRLFSQRKIIQIRLIASGVSGILLLLMSIFKDSAYFPSALSGHMQFFTAVLVIYILTLIVDSNVIIHGFTFKQGINYDLPVSLVNLTVLAHTAVMAFNESLWLDNGVLIAPAAVSALFMSQTGKLKMMNRIIDNFDFITDGADKFTVENMANKVDASIISRGFINSDPLIKFSVKTDFPTNFLEISCKNEPADKISGKTGLVMIGLNIVLMIAVGFIDNFNTGFNMAVCSMCAAVPLSSLYITNSLLCDVSRSLNASGSRVCGYEGAYMADNANLMVMEAADLFGKNGCDLHGIKTFHGAKVDDAILQAAAVIIQTKSPLAHVFDDVIIGKQSILPKAEDIIYEDKMGTSAWIYKKKVLVGNRNLLIRHGVMVPKESFEEKFTKKGRHALYLAVDGDIIAMFVVSYSADADMKSELKKLEKSGMTIIVKSCDPYINEQSLAQIFSLPDGFIRVMNSSGARVFEKYSEMNVEKSPAYVVHNGTARGFVSVMRASEILVSSNKIISFLITFGSALGLAVTAVLSLIGAYSQISALSVIVFQLIWCAFVRLVSKLKKIGL